MERCERHGHETRVRCSACNTPICPECMVDTAVGIKCPSCAAPPSGVISARRKARGREFGVSLTAGAASGLVFSFFPVLFLMGLLIGLAVTEALARFVPGGGSSVAAGVAGGALAYVVLSSITGVPLLALSFNFLITVLVVSYRLKGGWR